MEEDWQSEGVALWMPGWSQDLLVFKLRKIGKMRV
jgi:hypothetical protein